MENHILETMFFENPCLGKPRLGKPCFGKPCCNNCLEIYQYAAGNLGSKDAGYRHPESGAAFDTAYFRKQAKPWSRILNVVSTTKW